MLTWTTLPSLAINGSMGGQRVVEALARLALGGRKPDHIIDNGPVHVQASGPVGVPVRCGAFSRPGKPTDNAMIEAFNARLRAECLNESCLWRTLGSRGVAPTLQRRTPPQRPGQPEAFALMATAVQSKTTTKEWGRPR